jgi:aryl-alcohol dehydrogenase-like predicted oxidoreductase
VRKRLLGETGPEISVVGFGAWALGGGGHDWGWGPQDDADSIAAIRRAVELGVNWIDTAPAYGFGRSEEVVGRALDGLPERPFVFTKCGLVPHGREIVNNLEADSIKRECEDSLRRLGVEAIDLYQIHWPTPDADIEEAWSACVALKAEGKVRHIGVSNFDIGQLERVGAIAPVETLQPAYSLLRREIETEILPYCERERIGVLAYSPMGSGILSGGMTRERIAALPADDWRRNHPNFKEPRLTRNLELVERLRQIGAPAGASPGAVAVAWTLCNPVVTGAIVGFRSAAQVDGILPAAAELKLSAEQVEIATV